MPSVALELRSALSARLRCVLTLFHARSSIRTTVAIARLWISVTIGILLSVSGGCVMFPADPAAVTQSQDAYYLATVADVDYSAGGMDAIDPAVQTGPPDTINQRLLHDSPRYMALFDAIRQALENSDIIRTDAGFAAGRSSLLASPDFAESGLDPTIQNYEVNSGRRGVAAALSDFDPRFTTSMLWGRDQNVQNNIFNGGLPPGATLNDETGVFRSELEQHLPNGGSVSLGMDWDYRQNNIPNQLFNSAYRGILGLEYRQPLLAGAGTDYTQIAGPIDLKSPRISGLDVNQGVTIARLNTEISFDDFQLRVQALLSEVASLYWDLHLAYRTHEAMEEVSQSAEKTWIEVKANFDAGRVSAADEAQAADNFYQSRSRSEQALSGILGVETRLRRLIGLPVNDGMLIRPVDDPVLREHGADWHLALSEALLNRVELQRQRKSIQSLELQLRAARSLVLPRLDFVSRYRLNGFGDTLADSHDGDGVTQQGFNSAIETLAEGEQTGWNLGFELSTPLGVRAERSQIHSLELKLAKSRQILKAQEMDISHELSTVFQALDRSFTTAGTNRERLSAARRRVKTADAEFRAGRTSLDLLLRAQRSLAEAEIAWHESIAAYNKAIVDLQYRKGSLLDAHRINVAGQQSIDPSTASIATSKINTIAAVGDH